jgi:putative chitinase
VLALRLDQLQSICRHAPAARLSLVLPHLNKALLEGEVSTPARLAMFLAQIALESGEFRYSEELWGPSDAQCRYEPPSQLATRLGNTQPGDGKRFKGRGYIQLTGRSNYAKAALALGIDLVAHPDLAAWPEMAARIAAWYWRTHNCNGPADRGDVEGTTKLINGGLNGLEERERYFWRAKTALGVA